jgi:hypothetical protein
MKHAYLIIAHTDFELLKTLIHLLDDERNDLYLHIDKKVKNFNPKDFNTIHAKLFILQKRIDVRWAHFSQINVELLLFETAYKNGPYQYYHLISGVDLPLKSQDEIHHFCDTNAGKEFVGFYPTRDEESRKNICQYFFFLKYERDVNRYVQIFFSKLRRLIRRTIGRIFGERKMNLICKKGHNWVSITHAFCGYLLSHKKWIKKRFKFTIFGDENFLHTILWNSSFHNNLYNNNDANEGSMREIDWIRGRPYTWQIEDFDFLKKSNKLFARKFSSKTDQNIILQIKEHI